MRKANSRLAKEMDLQKFLHRQRVSITALLSLLKGRQSSFVDKFSQLVIRESSENLQTSEDGELSDWLKKDMEFVRKMIAVPDPVDDRLMTLLKFRLKDKMPQKIAILEESVK